MSRLTEALKNTPPQPRVDTEQTADEIIRRKIVMPENPPRNHKLLGIVVFGCAVISAGSLYAWYNLDDLQPTLPPKPNIALPPSPSVSASPALAINTNMESAHHLTDASAEPPTSSVPEVTAASIKVTPLLTTDEIKVHRTEQNTRMQQMDIAYRAYQSGDLINARQAYLIILRAEPNNIHALHALGNIALREKQFDQAKQFFERATTVNPQDVFSHSQLNTLPATKGSVAESRIKSSIAAQPHEISHYFALAQLYMQQSRWHEAQQILFNAYTLNKNDPDILYNLAVSLDHLKQPRLAVQYYRQALDASAHAPAAFKIEDIHRRIAQLD